MKKLLFAAALLVSGAAVAQTSGTTNTETSTQSGAPATSSSGATSAPERDARGIAVTSGSAAAPAGANQAPSGTGPAVPAPNQGAVFAAKPSDKDYKACTREVTDGCVQTYERGRKPN